VLYRYSDGDTTSAVTANGPEKKFAKMSEPHTHKDFQVMILQVRDKKVFINRDHTFNMWALFHGWLK
jgi:hypothetical protein